jgi:hypothetical protein
LTRWALNEDRVGMSIDRKMDQNTMSIVPWRSPHERRTPVGCVDMPLQVRQ